MSSDNSGKGKPETKQHHKGIIIYRHFQLRYTPRSVFEPCVMREPFHTPGNTLGAVFPSTEGSETKFFGFRYVFGPGSAEFSPFLCVYHPSRLLLGGHGKGHGIPRCAPHLRSRVHHLGAPGAGASPLSGWGLGSPGQKSLSSRGIWPWRLSQPLFLPK